MNDLIDKIVLKTFEKATENSVKKTRNALCTYISNWLLDKKNTLISVKTLTRIYDEFDIENNGKNKVQLKKHNESTIDALCIFLGKESYVDYKNNLHKKEEVVYRATIDLAISVMSPSKEHLKDLQTMIVSVINAVASNSNISIDFHGSSNDSEKHFLNSGAGFIYSWKLKSNSTNTYKAIVSSIFENIKMENIDIHYGIKKIEKENKVIFLEMKSGTTIIINKSSS